MIGLEREKYEPQPATKGPCAKELFVSETDQELPGENCEGLKESEEEDPLEEYKYKEDTERMQNPEEIETKEVSL